MAKLVYALNCSLDGYVDHDHPAFTPDPVLFQHFIEDMGSLSGAIYGRKMYELMRYWDDEQEGWDDAERAYAAAWQRTPKWVISRTLTEVGPSATLVSEDMEGTVRRLKTELDGTIEVAGPRLAGSLTDLGLIDEYVMYIHPVVLGTGTPFFTGARGRLQLAGNAEVGNGVVRVAYVDA